MKAIKKRLGLFSVSSGIGLSAIFIILFKDAVASRIHFDPVLLIAIISTVILLGSLIKEYRKYKAARLIAENRIMLIEAACIKETSGEKNKVSSFTGSIEVLISCFGILLDSRVIKFNIDGIKLKGVQISPEFISFSFGTEAWTRMIRILHGTISRQDLQCYIERLRYETGIVPVIKD